MEDVAAGVVYKSLASDCLLGARAPVAARVHPEVDRQLRCRLEIGTTYNSFLIFGKDKVALVDSSHEKFHDLYLSTLREQLAKMGRDKIDYIVVSHTEPDHSGLMCDLVDMFPDVTVTGSKVRYFTGGTPWRDSAVHTHSLLRRSVFLLAAAAIPVF
jgi:glyoxylase-like metal-dependent hydrolase (beta-lactamase superfamily II)